MEGPQKKWHHCLTQKQGNSKHDKELFFEEVKQQCIKKFTPDELQFLLTWMGPKVNRTITNRKKIPTINDDDEETENCLDNLNLKIFSNDDHRTGMSQLCLKKRNLNIKKTPMKSYERRLLTSPTKKQSSSEDKIFDSSEALAFYRKMIDKQNIIEKKLYHPEPLFQRSQNAGQIFRMNRRNLKIRQAKSKTKNPGIQKFHLFDNKLSECPPNSDAVPPFFMKSVRMQNDKIHKFCHSTHRIFVKRDVYTSPKR